MFGKKEKKRFAVLTSGGDAPGMNAAIRSIVRTAIYNECEIYGVMRGYAGLIEGEIKEMNARTVSNIITSGGTILKTSRCEEFKTAEGQKKAVGRLKHHGIDGLIVIGGNGSFQGAHKLSKDWGVNVVGVPGTIDNDITGTDYTIGADTAVNTALDAIDKIRDTVHSMERIFIVEVMGREEGFIAIRVGLTGGAEEIMIPEVRHDLDEMCEDIRRGRERGKMNWIVVVAEGVSSANNVEKSIKDRTGFEVRAVTLGHIQRGGSPTAMDRLLGLRLGAAAVEALLDGKTDVMIGIEADVIKLTGLEAACRHSQKKMALDKELYKLTKKLSI